MIKTFGDINAKDTIYAYNTDHLSVNEYDIKRLVINQGIITLELEGRRTPSGTLLYHKPQVSGQVKFSTLKGTTSGLTTYAFLTREEAINHINEYCEKQIEKYSLVLKQHKE